MAQTSLLAKMFQTPDKKKQADDDYFKKMFPFGQKQQQWENDMINKLIEDKKRVPTIKYVNFIRREMYIDGIAKQNDHINDKAYKKLLKRMKVTDEELSIIENLSSLQVQAKCFEELPTIDQILKK